MTGSTAPWAGWSSGDLVFVAVVAVVLTVVFVCSRSRRESGPTDVQRRARRAPG